MTKCTSQRLWIALAPDEPTQERVVSLNQLLNDSGVQTRNSMRLHKDTESLGQLPHITLYKNDFHTESEVSDAVEEIASTFESIEVEVGDIGAYTKNTIAYHIAGESLHTLHSRRISLRSRQTHSTAETDLC